MRGVFLLMLCIVILNDAFMIEMYALKKANKSLVDLNHQIFMFSDIAAYSRQMIQNHTINVCYNDRQKTSLYKVDLSNLNITSLYGWDLRMDNVVSFDVSGNNLKQVCDHQFPHGVRLQMMRCGIHSLENVVFDSREVLLSCNPVVKIKNLTFKACKSLGMWNCNITFEMLQEFEMKFIFGSVNWILTGNNLTVQQLLETNYTLPQGVDLISIGNDYYPNDGRFDLRIQMV